MTGSPLNNAALLDGTGSVDANGNWQLASQNNPVPVVPAGTGTNSFITEIDYNGGTNPTYIGAALPGTAVGSAGWQIQFITYDGNNNPLSVLFASGSAAFTGVWTSRGSYSYS